MHKTCILEKKRRGHRELHQYKGGKPNNIVYHCLKHHDRTPINKNIEVTKS